eukprot:4038331-Amphidinium_carterae.1
MSKVEADWGDICKIVIVSFRERKSTAVGLDGCGTCQLRASTSGKRRAAVQQRAKILTEKHSKFCGVNSARIDIGSI